MSRRRILIILNNYPQLSQTYVKTEIAALQDEYEIHVAALGIPNVADPVHHPFRITPDRASLLEMVREIEPDVLHAQHLVFIQLLASISRETGTPFTVRAHSFDALLPGEGQELPGYLKGIDRELNQDLCLGVLTFPFTRKGLESLGVRPDKIVDCPPVVDVARFLDRSPNTGGAMNVGAGIPKKKMEDFLAAGKAVPGIPFDLYVIGHGRDRLEKINRAMGSPVNIRPPVPYEEMPGVYKRHRWLLYTGCRQMRTVGWPMAVAEAQASGTMVLMPNLRPDLAEYVGEGGFLYDTLEEAIDVVRQPVPAWKRELGFEQAARWDARRHMHLLTDRWKSALR